MNLFNYNYENKEKPLSIRFRPKNINDIIGQKHILGKNKLLYKEIIEDKIFSLILFGPPGCGKTTITNVIANTTKNQVVWLNASLNGKKDIEERLKEIRENYLVDNKKIILFIDEIHRFNKIQQDFLLKFIEEGIVSVVGTTTENPYFNLVKSLLSRVTVFKLNPLSKSDIKKIIEIVVHDKKRGMGNYNVVIKDNIIEKICSIVKGDARRAINLIELAVLTTKKTKNGIVITNKIIEDCIQEKIITYDRDGENHYDIISAFIKSMRGSNPDAAVYYLAKMLEAGEDIKFIARRIIICASEDVGNANPLALILATNALVAIDNIGMPEAKIILAQAAIYVATSPKSNSSYKAINSASECVNNIKTSVPDNLKNYSFDFNGIKTNIKKYKYPHDFKYNYVKQQYLPEEIKDKQFYFPSNNGSEIRIKKYLDFLKNL